MTNNKNMMKIAILTMSFVQMGTNGIAPILALIAQDLKVTDATVQFLMTFPSIFMMIFTLACALLSKRLPKKLLAMLGLTLVASAGVLAFLFHQSITILFVWAAIMGIGIGLVAPIAPSLIAQLFEPNEQQTLLGQQNSAASVGSMLMTFFGGYLAVLGWHYGYFVYLLAIPGLILTALFIPSEKIKQESSNEKIRFPKIYREMLLACVFMILFNCGPTNLSMLVLEKGLGNSALAGSLATVFLLGGVLAGLLFGTLSKHIGRFTVSLGAACLMIGYILMASSTSVLVVGIGCLLSGASVSLFMPSCMLVASKQKGSETLASALILTSANAGVFMAPLLTTLASLITGSNNTAPRFFTAAVLALIVGIITSLSIKKSEPSK